WPPGLRHAAPRPEAALPRLRPVASLSEALQGETPLPRVRRAVPARGGVLRRRAHDQRGDDRSGGARRLRRLPARARRVRPAHTPPSLRGGAPLPRRLLPPQLEPLALSRPPHRAAS